MSNTGEGLNLQPHDTGFLGHPRGLATLFFTEMWERFSFYGMRALLVIYLTQHFLFSDEKAQGIYGSYAALVYLMPVIGGVLADRFLGARKAVTIGAALLVLGHFGMAFEGSGSRQYLTADGQSYVIATEGRGENRELFIDLGQGPAPLTFDVQSYLQLSPTVTNSAVPPLEFADEAFRIESEPPGFAQRFCAAVGIACGEPPKAVLALDGQGSYPIRAESGDRTVTIDGADYTLTEITRRDAVAVDPNAPDREIRRFKHGTFETPVEEEPLYVNILYLSLALIIVGVGFLKANISTTVGALYSKGDPRRDAGFTIFYLGINTGSVLATTACAILGITYGWKYGFGLAGIGMLLGLIQYLGGQRHLLGKADPPKPLPAITEGIFWILGLVAVIPIWLVVQQTELMEHTLTLGVPLLFLAVFLLAIFGFSGEERSKLIAALVMIFLSVIFWMLFEQAGSSLSLFAARSTDLTVAQPGTWGHVVLTGVLLAVAVAAAFALARCLWLLARKKLDLVLAIYGIAFPVLIGLGAAYVAVTTGLRGETYAMTSAQTQTFNPGYIVLLALPFSGMWYWLGKRGMEPSTPVKFAFALMLAGLGFFVLVLGTQFAGADYKVPLMFLALLYLLHSAGELLLSPVGLSMVTKLSPRRIVGLMMGVWFVASSLAHILAAIIAQRTSSETVGGEVVDPAAQLHTYVVEFTVVGVYGIGAGILLLLISPFIKRAMGDVR